MEGVAQWWRDVGFMSQLAQKLLLTLVVLAVIGLTRSQLLRYVHKRFDDPAVLYQWRKLSGYVSAVLIVALLLPIWLGDIQNLITYFGLLSAGLVIALQPLIVNLAGWIFILWRRPFQVGDRVQVGEHSGDVIDVRVFQFSLLEIRNWVDADQSTGRVIHVPNGKVFSEVQANFTGGFEYIWNEIPVLITFESDWRKAKSLLQEIADRHGAHLNEVAQEKVRAAARRYLIRYSTLSPTVYTSVKDSGVLLTIRYLCEPRRRRGSAQAIWEDILAAFDESSAIDFAYPTYRYYDNRQEGKPGMPPGWQE
jgi:small-conductance mechanosensitive channel